MAYAATTGDMSVAVRAAPGVLALQRALVWLVGASGAIVFIEPSPYEIVTLLATVTFFATGLRLKLVLMPLLLALVLLNVGYTISAIPLLDQSEVASWIATSWYMAVTVVFFAMVMSEDTTARLDMLAPRPRDRRNGRRALGGRGLFQPRSRRPRPSDPVRARPRHVQGSERAWRLPDPAGVVLAPECGLDKVGKAFRNLIAFSVMSLAILLAFSRAAWGGLVLTSAFMLALMVLTSRTNAQRSRIIIMAIVAVVLGLALIAVLLSFDSIAEMFKQRASFDQSYDEGRFGRFGRHILGAEMALDLPFGIGPLQFHRFFPEDTHNSYLNAFMSGGWLSGVCYPALVFTTVMMGFRHIFVRVPWQRAYLAVFSAFVGTVGESFVIDTDHWRHFWMMLGAMWGMIAAAQAYKTNDASSA